MPDYRELYYMLFTGIDEAIKEIEAQNYGSARDTLIELERAAEEQFMNDEEY